jgi:phi LC3 family holin
MKINWKVRKHNLVFIAQVAMAVLIPILAYFGLTISDVVTWQILGQTLLGAISNPYVIVLVIGSVFNAVTDPTTKGIGDSNRALSYDEPN